MDASLTNIGGKFFPAINSGGQLGSKFTEKPTIRYNRSAVTGVSLTSLSGIAQADFSFTVNTLKPTINLNTVDCRINFLDASAGTYNVTQLGILVVTSRLANDDFGDTNYVLSPAFRYVNLEMQIQLIDRQFSLRAIIQGGDVARISGITPGAGDTVNFFATVSYYV